LHRFFILLTTLSCIYSLPFFYPLEQPSYGLCLDVCTSPRKEYCCLCFFGTSHAYFNAEPQFAALAHVLCVQVLCLDNYLFAFCLKVAVLCTIRPSVCPFKCSRLSQGAEQNGSTLLPVCNYYVLGKKRDQVLHHYVRPC